VKGVLQPALPDLLEAAGAVHDAVLEDAAADERVVHGVREPVHERVADVARGRAQRHGIQVPTTL
jgi:hypothetical protein